MLTFHVVLYAVMLLAITALPCQETDPSPHNSVLSEIVESYGVENSTMEEALRALRQHDFANILIGFEKITHREGEKTESVSLSTKNATVGEILEQLCQRSKRYRYEVIEGDIIHVYPLRAESDPPGLLDIRVAEFSVQGKMLPATVIQRISVLAPELEAYLAKKRNAARATVSGSPGAILGGNMDPTIELQFHGLTVRHILNEVIRYSVQLRDQTAPDWTGNRLPTTSWIYEFVIDPNAATGLGGTPRWIAF